MKRRRVLDTANTERISILPALSANASSHQFDFGYLNRDRDPLLGVVHTNLAL